MRWQIYGVWISLMASALGIGLIVYTAHPGTASIQIRALFFITLFILVLSATTATIFARKNRIVRSRALNEPAFEPIFYDSFLQGLFASVILFAILLIKKVI